MKDFKSKRASFLTSSPIQNLSRLAQSCNAINLAEGFPDFPAPAEVKEAGIAAINDDFNQYRHVQSLCDLLGKKLKSSQGIDVDPINHIAICCGQSEAFAAAILAVVDDGDEVLLLDPVYETYGSCVRIAGGIPVYVSLDYPLWTLDIKKLEAAFTCKTKAIVINSPHNPTGKVFTKEELSAIGELCCRMDCLAITDEVYENITFDSVDHVSLASLPGMLERTIITSSLSKTYSVTGWRIGWAIATFDVISVIKNIHVKLTDSAPAPFQEAAIVALQSTTKYFRHLRTEYQQRRDFMIELLSNIGYKVHFKPQGATFVFAELPETCKLDDVAYVTKLIKTVGVAAVPGCGFFPSKENIVEAIDTKEDHQKRFIRFAFCKSNATLLEAADKLHKNHALVLRES